MLIKEIDEYGKRALLFTAPRRFGKSCAAEMIFKFYSKSDENGNKIKKKYSNKKLFFGDEKAENNSQRLPLKIAS
jgi:hypothetical protein